MEPHSYPWTLLPLPFLLLPSQIAHSEIYSLVPGFSVLNPMLLLRTVLLVTPMRKIKIFTLSRELLHLIRHRDALNSVLS